MPQQKKRSFIAIDIPKNFLDRLDKIIQFCKNKNLSSIRWTKSENIHLTLKFLGDVEYSKIDSIEKSIYSITNSYKSFYLNIGEFGVFPNWKRPRIIWVGIQPSIELQTLVYSLEEGLKAIGFESEARKFSPHLTIGRVNENVQTSEIKIIQNNIYDLPINKNKFLVDQIKLYQSVLNPTGPTYTILSVAPLIT